MSIALWIVILWAAAIILIVALWSRVLARDRLLHGIDEDAHVAGLDEPTSTSRTTSPVGRLASES